LRFEWPVYAAVVIFFVGRITYSLIVNYETGGLAAVIVGSALALAVAGVLVWRRRRQIRRWAAEEPHDRDSEPTP
jgi:LPXTG-motif cell wall-anchored protein